MPYKNPADRLAWRRRYAEKNKAYSKEWALRNPDRVREYAKRSRERKICNIRVRVIGGRFFHIGRQKRRWCIPRCRKVFRKRYTFGGLMYKLADNLNNRVRRLLIPVEHKMASNIARSMRLMNWRAVGSDDRKTSNPKDWHDAIDGVLIRIKGEVHWNRLWNGWFWKAHSLSRNINTRRRFNEATKC